MTLKNPSTAMPPRIRKIIKTFIDNVPTRLAAIQKAWDQNDINELSALLHQFKGTSGSCGLSPLRHAAEVLEKQLQTAPLPEFVAPLLVNLEGIARQIKVDWEKME